MNDDDLPVDGDWLLKCGLENDLVAIFVTAINRDFDSIEIHNAQTADKVLVVERYPIRRGDVRKLSEVIGVHCL